MDNDNLRFIDSKERVLNLNNKEDQKLIVEWITKNKDKLPNIDVFTKFDMSNHEYLYHQEERDTERAIASIKNMKNIDLKEKYKGLLTFD